MADGVKGKNITSGWRRKFGGLFTGKRDLFNKLPKICVQLPLYQYTQHNMDSSIQKKMFPCKEQCAMTDVRSHQAGFPNAV